MKLTNYQRQAFIRAAMDDVPRTDFNEVVRVKVQKFVLEQMPDALRNEYKEHRDWFHHSYAYMPGMLSNVEVVSPSSSGYYIKNNHPDLYEEIVAIAEQHQAQSDKLQELENGLRCAIGTCTTVKKAVELLPEFAKYLPQERQETTGLPMVIDVINKFVAAGWPKEGATA